MANFECAQRTNYFHVKDPESFREMMGRVTGNGFRFWEEADAYGNPAFAFGAEGSIGGIPYKDVDGEMVTDDNSYDHFIAELGRHVAEGEAVILLTAGHEKLRYVSGDALIITGKGTDFIDLSQAAVKLAGEMLGNPEYSPKMEY